MASNISQDTLPFLWASANDNVTYTFSFNPYVIDYVADDVVGSFSTGYTIVSLMYDFDVTPIIGEYLYIASGSYAGAHRIVEVSGTSLVKIDFPYVGSVVSNTVNCYHLRIPSFSLYKGFKPLEGLSPLLPYEFISEVKPSVLYDSNSIPYLSINVKGLVSKIFDVDFFGDANEIDTSVFYPIRFSWDTETTTYDVSQEYTFALNCAISNDELLNKIAGGFYLTPIDKPLIDSQGITFATEFTVIETYPRLRKFINGVKQ